MLLPKKPTPERVCGGGGRDHYHWPGADALQRPLRSRFQARLRPGVDMTSNVKSWRKNSRLFVTFGEYQMMAQLVTRRWLISPLIYKDFRAYRLPLGHGHCASVTLHHQK
jgi:hypothetical protein